MKKSSRLLRRSSPISWSEKPSQYASRTFSLNCGQPVDRRTDSFGQSRPPETLDVQGAIFRTSPGDQCQRAQPHRAARQPHAITDFALPGSQPPFARDTETHQAPNP